MTVNHGHVRIRVLQTPGRLQTTETTTDDHHPAPCHSDTVTVMCHLRPPSQSMALRCARTGGFPGVEILPAGLGVYASGAASHVRRFARAHWLV